MITIGGKEIPAAYVGKRALSAVYAGARLVWSAISSCFGLGYWKGDEPDVYKRQVQNLVKKAAEADEEVNKIKAQKPEEAESAIGFFREMGTIYHAVKHGRIRAVL